MSTFQSVDELSNKVAVIIGGTGAVGRIPRLQAAGAPTGRSGPARAWPWKTP